MTREGLRRAEPMSDATPAPIAVVAAMREEIAPLIRRVQVTRQLRLDACRVTCGTLNGTPLLLAHTGDGRQRAERGATALLQRFPVEKLFVVGVSGGLSPLLDAESLIVACQVRDGDMDVPPPDAGWLARATGCDSVRAATVLTSDRILCTRASKREAQVSLDPQLPAAVDLESAAYARTAASFGVGYLVLRAISDTVDEELPFDLNLYRDVEGRVDRGKVARQALLHPTSMPDLLKLRGRVARSAERLADLVETLLDGAPA
jgi:nucleoside phosphorylase